MPRARALIRTPGIASHEGRGRAGHLREELTPLEDFLVCARRPEMAWLIGQDLERHALAERGVGVRCCRLVAVNQGQQLRARCWNSSRRAYFLLSSSSMTASGTINRTTGCPMRSGQGS